MALYDVTITTDMFDYYENSSSEGMCLILDEIELKQIMKIAFKNGLEISIKEKE